MKTEKELYLAPIAIGIAVVSEHVICYSANATIEEMDEENYDYEI